VTRKRKRVVAFSLLGCICLGIFVAVAIVTSSSFLEPRAERVLRDVLDSSCRIEGLGFGVFAGVSAERVEVSLPEQEENEAEPVVVLEGLRIRHSLLHLIRGRFRVRSVFVRNVRLRITPEVVRWIRGLQRPGAGELPQLPQIEVADGTVSVDLPEMCDAFSIDRLNFRLLGGNVDRMSGAASFALAGDRYFTELQSRGPDQDILLRLEIPDARLAGLPRPHIGGAGSVWEHLDADGQVRGTLSVRIPVGGEDRRPVVRGDLFVAELNLSHPELPVAFTDIAGACRVSDRNIEFEEVIGNVGKGDFSVETGRISLREGKAARVALRGWVRGFNTNRLAHIDLPPELARSVEYVGLQSGEMDIEFDIVGAPGNDDYAIGAVVSLRDGKVQPKPVPVPFDDVHITARVASDGSIGIEQARAAVNGGRVSMAGYVRRAADGTMVPDLAFVLSGVPLEQEMLQKVPGNLHELLQTLGIEGGKLDGELRLNSDKVAIDGRITATTMRAEAVPYTLQDVSGTIHWSSDERGVVIDTVTARHGKGTVRGSGAVTLGDVPAITFDLEGRDVPIDEELHAVVPPEVRELWQRWTPTGRFDFSLHMRDKQFAHEPGTGEPLAGIDTYVRLKNISITHKESEQTVKLLHGTLLASENRAELVGLVGEAFGVQLSTDGYVSFTDGQPRGVVRVRSPRTELTAELVADWPEKIAQQVRRFGTEGGFEVVAELRPFSADATQGVGASLDVILHDLALRVNGTPVSTTGRLHANTENIVAKEIEARGSTQLNRLRLGPVYGNDLVARVDYSGDRISLSRVDMKVFGGMLAVEEGFCALPEMDWAINGRISHVHLETLLTALGMERKEVPSGVVGGTFELRGNRLGVGALRGNGELNVVRGRLYDIPIVMSVLNLFDLRLPGAAGPVSDGYTAFRIENQTLYLDDLLLLGGSVPIHCRGTIGMEPGVAAMDQQIDLLFTIPKQRGILDAIPVVNWAKYLLIDPLRRYAFQARVTGTLGEYKVSSLLRPVTEPITRVGELLQRLSPPQVKE